MPERAKRYLLLATYLCVELQATIARDASTHTTHTAKRERSAGSLHTQWTGTTCFPDRGRKRIGTNKEMTETFPRQKRRTISSPPSSLFYVPTPVKVFSCLVK